MLLATGFHYSTVAKLYCLGLILEMVFGWMTYVSPRIYRMILHQRDQRRLSINKDPYGCLIRSHEGREKYKLGKVFLLTLAGCLVFQLVQLQIAGVL